MTWSTEAFLAVAGLATLILYVSTRRSEREICRAALVRAHTQDFYQQDETALDERPKDRTQGI